MASYLCITVRFLQPCSHGRGEGGGPEWPPSPLRLFQAMAASSAGRYNERITLASAVSALKWLETQAPPSILAADAVCSDRPYRLYVPDNVADKVAAAWCRGRDADIANYRTEKDVRPAHLLDEAVHYVYPLSCDECPHASILVAAARSITHLGWGVDIVAGDAQIMSDEQVAMLDGNRWRPTRIGGTQLRIPVRGTLDNLMQKHKKFLDRMSNREFNPVPPLRVFQFQGYHRNGEPAQRPYRVFELRKPDGNPFRYPPRRLIHIAGMVRHLAREAMKRNPPRGVAKDWIETYIAGHVKGDRAHRQLSYLPLPSIGHLHTDPGVRRVLIAAPVGDDDWLSHVARLLAGQRLIPERGDEFSDGEPPLLVPIRDDNVSRLYTRPANTWASVTPVILPGHDDHKPAKRTKLIERALAQSGIEQPCEFEWSIVSHFPKSYSAHKHDREGRPVGYIRPDHLLSQTAVHLKLRFKDGMKVSGPIAIGAGRHCGFGLMAGIDDDR